MTNPTPPARRRRTARRIVLAIGVLVLLSWVYLASYFVAVYLSGRGVIDRSSNVFYAYVPLFHYREGNYPGSYTFHSLELRVFMKGLEGNPDVPPLP